MRLVVTIRRGLKLNAQRTRSFEYCPPISPHIEPTMENWKNWKPMSTIRKLEANEHKLKKQGSVTKKRKFVVVSCLLSESKYQLRFRFGFKI